MSSCGVPDSCAYLGLAESLSKTHTFTERFLFDFQLDRIAFPTHGIEYWRPGTSFFFLLAQPFGGVTLHSSLLITVLAGVFLALAAWRIAVNFTQNRSVACASYILCLLFPPLWGSSIIPDSGLFYAAFVAWFLALFTVNSRTYLRDIAALLCLSVAYLIRNDALLLFIPFVAVVVLRLRGGERRASSWSYCLLLLAGFAVALAPMHLLYAHVLGSAFPSGSSKVLFMHDLDDFSRFHAPVTLSTWLSSGIIGLVKVRAATLPLILYRILFIVVGFGFLFLPVLFIRRADGTSLPLPETCGPLTFAVTILLTYSMVLPAIGVFSALRTFMGLLPFVALCIVLGIRAFAGSPKLATVLTATVCLLYCTSGIMDERRIVSDAGEQTENYQRIVRFLAAHQVTPQGSTLVMTADPVQFAEATNYAAIQLPSNGLEAMHEAANEFHVTHLLVDTSFSSPDLATLRSSLHAIGMTAIPGTHTVILTLPTATQVP